MSRLDEIIFFDYVLPALTPHEQAIATQIFARTVLDSEATVSMSLADLQSLTNLGESTARRALRSLIGKGVVKVDVPAKARKPASYSVILPANPAHSKSAQRKLTVKAISKEPLEKSAFQTVELTTEGKALVEGIKGALTQNEMDSLRRKALERAGGAPEPVIEELIASLIAEKYFGPEKLKKYTV